MEIVCTLRSELNFVNLHEDRGRKFGFSPLADFVLEIIHYDVTQIWRISVSCYVVRNPFPTCVTSFMNSPPDWPKLQQHPN